MLAFYLFCVIYFYQHRAKSKFSCKSEPNKYNFDVRAVINRTSEQPTDKFITDTVHNTTSRRCKTV